MTETLQHLEVHNRPDRSIRVVEIKLRSRRIYGLPCYGRKNKNNRTFDCEIRLVESVIQAKAIPIKPYGDRLSGVRTVYKKVNGSQSVRKKLRSK